MDKFAFGMIQWIIIEEKHRLGIETIRILGGMIGICVMRPMLIHPQPLASTDSICTKSQKVIHPGFLWGSSMIRIVLNVQSNQSGRHTIGGSETPGSALCGPLVAQGGHEANVKEGTCEVAGSTKFTSTSNNLKHFAFDLTLKFCVPFITVQNEKSFRSNISWASYHWKYCTTPMPIETKERHLLRLVIHNLTDHLHLLQVLLGMIRMNHFVLHRYIIPSKNLDGVSSWMLKPIQCINDSINSYFILTKVLENFGSCGLRGWIQAMVIFFQVVGKAITKTGDICIRGHDFKIWFSYEEKKAVKWIRFVPSLSWSVRIVFLRSLGRSWRRGSMDISPHVQVHTYMLVILCGHVLMTVLLPSRLSHFRSHFSNTEGWMDGMRVCSLHWKNENWKRWLSNMKKHAFVWGNNRYSIHGPISYNETYLIQ